MFVLMGFAWVLSTNRRRLSLRVVAWGNVIQLSFGCLVFGTPLGPWMAVGFIVIALCLLGLLLVLALARERVNGHPFGLAAMLLAAAGFGGLTVGGASGFFLWLNDRIVALLEAAKEGQRFLFGPLADEGASGFILALQALPVIIFFAAVMALLYHWRIMPLIVRGFGWVFSRLMSVSGAESLCVASNIFVGIESATAVRPYLARMTRSEFCTILTAGMATVASSTLGVYVLFLRNEFPTIAGHLISASLLSAPAAIVMSKILVPEDGTPLTLGKSVRPMVEPASNSIEALINGAMAGVRLVVGICALLIAFLGIIAVADLLLEWCGLPGLRELLGMVMAVFALVIGVVPADALTAGELLGERLIATEIPAYLALARWMTAGHFEDPRSAVILAYALCGFAHVASMAIFVGGIAALVPERRRDLAAVGPRALLAATLACLMTGAVAGVFFSGTAAVLNAAP
jgi:CNT family concentrative nucleoside transporter